MSRNIRRLASVPLAMLVIAFAAIAPEVRCETEVASIVDDEIWTTNGSPYLVSGDVLVSKLLIESGVEVRFLTKSVFEVQGTIRANGTAAKPILFRAADAALGWQGILFNTSDEANFLTYCRIEGAKNSGIRITNTSLALTNCVIADNSSTSGGAGIIASVGAGRLVLVDCTITNNTLTGSSWGGGGLLVNGQADIKRCLFAYNKANTSDISGGGGLLVAAGAARVLNSIITRNSSQTYGGGICVWRASVTVVNSLVTTNTAASQGAGMTIHGNPGNSATVVNSTLVGNGTSAINNGGSLYLTNSILYSNNGGGAQIQAGSISQSYCDIQNGITTGGNIDRSPVLNPTTLQLLSASPCIDAGNPSSGFDDACLPPSKGSARNDMGAFGGPGACDGLGPRTDLDSDRDGLPDGWEIEHFGNITSHSGEGDPDSDSLDNAAELDLGTDPTAKDSDGDGFSDYAEVKGRSDPLDAASLPPVGFLLEVSQVRLEMLLASGKNYELQVSSGLNNWVPLETLPGKGELEVRFIDVTNNFRYFQLIQK